MSCKKDHLKPGINFASGPCAKPPFWKLPACELIGRSHRSDAGLAKIQELLHLQRKILKLPNDYYIAIVSGSTTGAVETLLWSLVGERGVDVLNQCVFSNHWANDIINELKIANVRQICAEFPRLSDVSQVDFNRDVVFCRSSTTSGVCFVDDNWLKVQRNGLVICDASSAAYILDFDWKRYDAVAFSWQKGIGGEAGLGTIILSPRAITRLETYEPERPIPRIFKIANNKIVNFKLFNGYLINTPSMLCIEDFYNCLKWAEKIGGLETLQQRVEQNYSVAKNWLAQQEIFRFLVEEKFRAHHIICLDLISEKYQALTEQQKWHFLKKIAEKCAADKIGYDIIGHIATKPHLRIWSGPTIEHTSLAIFFHKLQTITEEFLYNL